MKRAICILGIVAVISAISFSCNNSDCTCTESISGTSFTYPNYSKSDCNALEEKLNYTGTFTCD